MNSGQSCNAPTRMLIPAKRYREAVTIACAALQDLFGGYKQSGNGREWGREGFREFLEVKSVMGFY